MTSGWMPMPRSSLTECWVGLVLSSPVAARAGSSVTWTYRTLARPWSLRIWRMASRNGRLSMSPTVPPTSTITTSGSPARATRVIRSLISLVMCGMTWTVPPEVVAAALLRDHGLVDAAGRDVGALGQVLVDEPLVVAQVEVGLGAVVGDEHLAVLVGRHRPRVDVDVRVELEDRDLETPCLEQAADAGGGDAFAKRGGHASGHKDILRHGSGPPGVFPMLSIRGLGVESDRRREAGAGPPTLPRPGVPRVGQFGPSSGRIGLRDAQRIGCVRDSRHPVPSAAARWSDGAIWRVSGAAAMMAYRAVLGVAATGPAFSPLRRQDRPRRHRRPRPRLPRSGRDARGGRAAGPRWRRLLSCPARR